jgi:shikimate kinase
MMAVGKTTVGRLVAAEIGRNFVDLDQLMVDERSMSVAQMFAEHGEAWFRALEADTLERVLNTEDPLVVSLGGGAVTTPRCCELLSAHAFVVWLRANPTTVLSRIGDPSTRPLLAADPEGAVRALDAARKDLYSSVAHLALSVDRRTPRWVASTIVRRLGSVKGST